MNDSPSPILTVILIVTLVALTAGQRDILDAIVDLIDRIHVSSISPVQEQQHVP